MLNPQRRPRHQSRLQSRRRPLKAAAAAAAILGAALPAAAHPHLCVSVEATVLHDKADLTGLKQKWTFTDERYIAEAVDGLDKNKDGKLDRSELDELAKVNIESMKDIDYFTYPTVADQPVKLGQPTDYWMEYTTGALSLYFTLPFATPVPIGGKGLNFIVRDNENYIAFGLPKKGPAAVSLDAGAPKSCRITVELPPAEEQEIYGQILEALGCTINLPKSISVSCGGS